MERNFYKGLYEYLNSNKPRRFFVLSIDIGHLGVSFGKRAYHHTIDDCFDMKLMATSISLSTWAAVFECEFYYNFSTTPNDSLTLMVPKIANLICCSPHWAEQGEAYLRRMVQNVYTAEGHPDVIPEFWEERRFEPFVLACLDLQQGRSPDLSQLKAPYRQVLETFDHASECARALKDVCDYHLEQSQARSDWPEAFESSPFNLLPCEVKLVNRVRQSLGYEPLEVDHELVHFFKNSMTEIPPAPELPIIGEIREAFRQAGVPL